MRVTLCFLEIDQNFLETVRKEVCVTIWLWIPHDGDWTSHHPELSKGVLSLSGKIKWPNLLFVVIVDFVFDHRIYANEIISLSGISTSGCCCSETKTTHDLVASAKMWGAREKYLNQKTTLSRVGKEIAENRVMFAQNAKGTRSTRKVNWSGATLHHERC